jgi:hypothetical protein
LPVQRVATAQSAPAIRLALWSGGANGGSVAINCCASGTKFHGRHKWVKHDFRHKVIQTISIKTLHVKVIGYRSEADLAKPGIY